MAFSVLQAIVHFWRLETVFRAAMHAVGNTLISGLIKFRQSHYIKEYYTSLNWRLEDKIYTVNYNKPEFVLTAWQIRTLISRQWPALLLRFDASLHHHQSQNPHLYWPRSGFGIGRMTKASGLNMENRWVNILCFESILKKCVEPLPPTPLYSARLIK